mgnify:CR=1 FL=1
MSKKEQKIMRPGKTAKDRKRGAVSTNAENKQKRADWSNDSNRSNANFPKDTCNGKKNRYTK